MRAGLGPSSGASSGAAFSISDEWVALDLETTGLDFDLDRIIEVGAVLFRDGRPADRFASLVNPHQQLPARIAALTGLKAADLAEAPEPGQVLPALLAFVGERPVVGHNLKFDLTFLARALAADPALAARAKVWPALAVDTLELARIILPRSSSHALAALDEASEADAEDAQGEEDREPTRRHRAGDDALAAGELACRLWRRGLQYQPRTLAAADFFLQPAEAQLPGLAAFLGGLRAALGTATQAAQGARLQPSDQHPASTTDERAAGASTAPVAGGTEAGRLPKGQLSRYVARSFSVDGLLSASIPGYEVRPEQQAMCDAVMEVLDRGGRLAVEAGTGVGKSLAYLVPAVALAEERAERVVISTHTVTLQDQLEERELPLLEQALGRRVNRAVLKGRANYLCLRKWDDFYSGSLVATEEERLFGLRILFWSSATATGDVAELNVSGPEGNLWSLVSGDEHCWGAACPRHRDCLILRARAAAAEADIVIANHALVCSDVLSDGKLLPPYQHLIVDEAHHLEEVATGAFGLTAEEADIAALIGSVVPGRGHAARAFSRLSVGDPGRPAEGGRWPTPGDLADAARLGLTAQGAARSLFSELSRFAGSRRPIGPEPGYLELRYGQGQPPLPQPCQTAAIALAEAMRTLATKLSSIAERATGGPTAGLEIAAAARDCALRAAAVESLGRAADPGWVYWLSAANGNIRLSGAPVTVAQPLQASLWAKVKSAVLVSATLAVAGSFSHIVGQLGLGESDGEEPTTLLLHSPFDFRSQALLCVPRDLPLPGAAEADAEYAGAVAAFLTDLLPATGGRSLVLFTSHRMLRQVYDLTAAELLERGLNLQAQGIDGGRSRLLRALRQEPSVVIFGTSTFWEGIDVKGPQLSCLVIARLPFPRPDEPLTAARIERLEAEGRSSFDDLTLPRAVLRLKQGFGRLIRAADDRGVVVILDGRVIRRRYGRLFLDSLPPATFYHGSRQSVVARVRAWLDNEERPAGVTWIAPPPRGDQRDD